MNGSNYRVRLFESAGNPAHWPTVLTEALEPKEKEIYLKRCKAIVLYYEGHKIEYIKEVTSIADIIRLVKRCCLLAPDNQIWGFRALLPHQRIRPYRRISKVQRKLPEGRGGHAGALEQLFLSHPDIELYLVSLILKSKKRSDVYEHKISARSLHWAFLRKLKEKGLSEMDWPFNTKHKAARSIASFLKKTIDNNFSSSVRARESSTAKAHLNLGIGKTPLVFFSDPYQAIEVDAHHIDAHSTVRFLNPSGTLTPVLIERLWILAVIDRASTCVLAISVIYRSEVGADDVIRVIAKAADCTWQRTDSGIPGVTFSPGAGYPWNRVEKSKQALWGTVMLDGALANLSTAVRERARKKLGFSLNYGPVAHFERRPNVERFFLKIHNDLFGRFVSTTGSNPHKGRAEDAEDNAIKYMVNAEEIERIIDVYTANHNATVTEGLFGLTPLEFIEQKCSDGHFIFRHLPNVERSNNSLLPCIEHRRVNGSHSSGRRPYVVIDRVRYTSDVLSGNYGLANKTILVEINEEDMRQVRAYLENGTSLGFLRADHKWGVYKHSRRLRKAINSLITRKLIHISNYDDPVTAYHRYLSGKAKGDRTQLPKLSAKDATKAVSLSNETGIPLRISNTKQKSLPEDNEKLRSIDSSPVVAVVSPIPDLNSLVNKSRRS
jgi:putative transposase